MPSLKENLILIDNDVKSIRSIEKLLNLAVSAEAAEICFEPKADNFSVIFRAGSEIKNKISLPKKSAAAILGGLREMASGKNGSFKQEFPGYKIIFSLNVRPTTSGEQISIDLHQENFKLLEINRLGFSTHNLAAVKNILEKRKGLVLVLGDFNSGRTTTLYSFLNFINKPEFNLATLENHIAFDLPEINQSRLDPISGYDSVAAFRSLRRQDVDAVMIGEIIDKETAASAMSLAQSGRFVLAGLHAHNLPAALSFFQDLSLAPSLFSESASLAITQRLAVRNCPHCLKQQRIGRDSLKKLSEKIALKKLLPSLKRDKIISEKIKKPEDLIFYKSSGCQRCHNSGVVGKIGIFEVLEITPAVKNIIKTGHFSLLRQETEKQGGHTLAEDALIKSLSGLIPIDEVFRIIDKA